MKTVLSVIRKSILDFLLFAVVSIFLGLLSGLVIYSGNESGFGGVADPTGFQNMSYFAGALIGLAVCLTAFLVYGLVQVVLFKKKFNLAFLLILCLLAGTATTILTVIYVHVNAPLYKVAEKNVTALDYIMSLIFGGGFAVLAGWLLTRIRNYDG